MVPALEIRIARNDGAHPSFEITAEFCGRVIAQFTTTETATPDADATARLVAQSVEMFIASSILAAFRDSRPGTRT